MMYRQVFFGLALMLSSSNEINRLKWNHKNHIVPDNFQLFFILNLSNVILAEYMAGYGGMYKIFLGLANLHHVGSTT